MLSLESIGRSSNGRTHPSGGCYLGSSPSLPAIKINTIKIWEFLEQNDRIKNIGN